MNQVRPFRLKGDDPLQRNCQNKLSHPGLSHIDVVCTTIPLSAGTVKPPTKFFEKGRWLDSASIFRETLQGVTLGGDFCREGGGGSSSYIRNKLKSLMTKKNQLRI